MTVPTATDLKMRHPSFVNFDDGDVEFAIEEAVLATGTQAATSGSDWINDLNLTVAIMYYACHLLQLAKMRAGSGTGLIKTSERTPEFGVTYTAPPWPNPEKPIDFTQTIYGIRYLGLVKKNFPPVVVVNSAIRF